MTLAYRRRTVSRVGRPLNQSLAAFFLTPFRYFVGTGTGVAFGVTIGALTTQSCDASWIPGSTSWNLGDASFKLMELDGLSVYWDHLKKEEFLGNLSLGDLAVSI